MSFAVSLAGAPVIATYTDLVAAVKSELDRDDVADTKVLEFVQRFEARMNRILRVPEMETVASVAVTDGVGDFPTDFLELRRVYDSENVVLPGVEPTVWIEALAGEQKVHCIVGGRLRIAPESTENVSILYYGAIPPLNIDQQTNWLLAGHADLYLYGCCYLFCSHVDDDDGVAKYKLAADEVLSELIEQGLRRRFGGPLRHKSSVTQVRGACA